MPFRALFVFVLCAWSLSACALLSGSPVDEEQEVPTVSYDRLQQLATNRFGPGAAFIYLPNEAADYVLVKQRTAKTATQPIPVTNYFVYEPKRDRVVIEEDGLTGTVDWQGNNHLRVQRIPGIIQREGADDAQTEYLVDVRTGERRNPNR